jgi:flagellar biosynthesis protein FliP
MLVDPIGFLGILTIFVVLVSVARKVAVVVLVAGWALILVRIVLMAFKVG